MCLFCVLVCSDAYVSDSMRDFFFLFSSRRRHTRCALVTGVQTCALPIFLMTGATADPTTDPRPVVNSVRCAPHDISSTISALSEMLGKPNLGGVSGTTSSRYRPGSSGIWVRRIKPLIGRLPDLT